MSRLSTFRIEGADALSKKFNQNGFSTMGVGITAKTEQISIR